MMNLTGEAVGRKPFGQRVAIKKRAIHFFGRRAEDTVKPDGVCWHDFFSFARLSVRFFMSATIGLERLAWVIGVQSLFLTLPRRGNQD
jgi:hypothetical protein